jgi:hypothetical protein
MNVPRHATKYTYVIDGVGVGGLISRADHGPFSSPSRKCPMADVSVGDTWRQLQFADIELTGTLLRLLIFRNCCMERRRR